MPKMLSGKLMSSLKEIRGDPLCLMGATLIMRTIFGMFSVPRDEGRAYGLTHSYERPDPKRELGDSPQ